VQGRKRPLTLAAQPQATWVATTSKDTLNTATVRRALPVGATIMVCWHGVLAFFAPSLRNIREFLKHGFGSAASLPPVRDSTLVRMPFEVRTHIVSSRGDQSCPGTYLAGPDVPTGSCHPRRRIASRPDLGPPIWRHPACTNSQSVARRSKLRVRPTSAFSYCPLQVLAMLLLLRSEREGGRGAGVFAQRPWTLTRRARNPAWRDGNVIRSRAGT
jgi:hypothetical protein